MSKLHILKYIKSVQLRRKGSCLLPMVWPFISLKPRCVFYSASGSGLVFMWEVIAVSSHQALEVLIVLSFGVGIISLLSGKRSVSHGCSCVDQMSARDWQLIIIKATVREGGQDVRPAQRMSLAFLKTVCYFTGSCSDPWALRNIPANVSIWQQQHLSFLMQPAFIPLFSFFGHLCFCSILTIVCIDLFSIN